LGAASDPDRERIALELLNYGFTHFRTVTPAEDLAAASLRVYKGAVDQVAVRPATRPRVTVPVDDVDNLRWELALPGHLEAPLVEGQRVGELKAVLADDELASFEVVTAAGVERGGFFKILFDT